MKSLHCFTWELNQLVEIMETEHNKVPVIPAEEFAYNYVNSVLDPEEYFSTVPNENIIIISHAQFLSEKYNIQKGVIEFAKHFPNPNGTGSVLLQSDIPSEEIDFCDELKELLEHE